MKTRIAFPSGAATENLILAALHEDIGSGDATTLALVPEAAKASAVVMARQDGVLAGGPVVASVFRQLDPAITIKLHQQEGQSFRAGCPLITLQGKARALLTGERTALNFLQRLSGIATATASYVNAIQPYPVPILDTRKTTPLLRTLEKYAVRCGGGLNHRMGLYDRIMIKDNHVALWQTTGKRSLAEAVRTARSRYPELLIEVEVDHIAQLETLLDAPPDWVLLDNMTPEQVRTCVALCAGRTKLEVSGGITLETVAAYAAAGPDALSVGGLTHSVQSLDLALDWGTGT